jgi:hypothetical protein
MQLISMRAPNSPEGLMAVMIVLAWLFIIPISLFRQWQKTPRSRLLLIVSGVLTLVGGESFFAPSLLLSGVVQPSANFDWPAGFVSGVVQTPDNLWVVPEISPGRVQVYDSNWHFLRGWQVKSFGKKFRIACNSAGTIGVFTAQGTFFTENGLQTADFFREEDVSDTSGSTSGTKSLLVPTRLWLMPLADPVAAWTLAAFGGLGLFFYNLRNRKD